MRGCVFFLSGDDAFLHLWRRGLNLHIFCRLLSSARRIICSVRDQSVCTLLHDRLGGVTNARVIMGCCPDIVGSHSFDEVVRRGLQHILQVNTTSEFAKPCLVPATVPCSFDQVAWLNNQRSVDQWGLFPAIFSLEVVIQMDSVYTESK